MRVLFFKEWCPKNGGLVNYMWFIKKDNKIMWFSNGVVMIYVFQAVDYGVHKLWENNNVGVMSSFIYFVW